MIMATIKQWVNAFYVLGKALGQTIITEWNNPNSPFINHDLTKDEFNKYMAWVEIHEVGYTRYGQRCDGKYRFFDYFGTFDGYNGFAEPIEPPYWFIVMVNKNRDLFIEISRVIWVSYSTLITDRKWTKSLAEKYLPEPEHSYEYQANGYTKMYHIDTVLAIEQSPEFQADWAVLQAKRAKRKNSNSN